MADEPKTDPKTSDEAPDGFWTEFAGELGKKFLSDDETGKANRQSLFEQFLTDKGKQAPAPGPNDPPPPSDGGGKKKGWFTS